jgi:hypothetical protein
MADVRVLPNNGEVEPATFTQMQRGRNGKMVEIDDDVGNIASDLRSIHPNLRLRFSEAGRYFVVYMREDWQPPGDGYLVTTAQELDQRLVDRIRRISSEGYDFAKEIDRVDGESERAQEHRRYEQVGEIAERLAHALRKDRGMNGGRVFVPKEVTDGE